jgi:sodium transport system ATP-binding protein
MEDYAVSIRNLVKKFGSLTAVDNVSLDIPQGLVYGLLGPNGAGKTTIIRVLSTVLKPSSGTASVNGFDVLKEPEKVRGECRCAPGGYGIIRPPKCDGDASILWRSSRHAG